MVILHILAAVFGVLLFSTILRDSFETVVLPRRIQRRFSLSRLFYRSSWIVWSSLGRKLHNNRRETYLSYFGPLSLIFLLIVWALGLIFSFALVQWACFDALQAPEKAVSFGTYLYLSGTTFITLGLGDVIPLTWPGRIFAVMEAGIGFGFLALIIGYVPIIYQAFSRRELQIALLDARAGSPPSATEWIRRQLEARERGEELSQTLHEWELWCADILESHLSYPVLTYYRSQHERQSWLGALTMVLDTCTLLMVGLDNLTIPNARFTFRIARHAAVDLAQYFGTPPMQITHNRLSSEDFARLSKQLAEVGLRFREPEVAEQRLAELRRFYEPFISALADHLFTDLPSWIPPEKKVDDWMTSAWDHFADWSPAKIEEIQHIILDHHKKIPVHHDHNHEHQPDEQHA